jgi:hypothetical protein
MEVMQIAGPWRLQRSLVLSADCHHVPDLGLGHLRQASELSAVTLL